MRIKIKYMPSFLKHKDLILELTSRELQLRHKGSRLGHSWSIISPLLMLCLYVFVFGVIFHGRFGVLEKESFLDFALALFLGLSIFNVISETISISPTLIISQPNFVKKIVFPLELLSLTKVITSFYHSLLSILICILLSPFSSGGISKNIFLLPLILIPLLFVSLGLSLGIAAVGLFIRDINNITGFAASALMYASAIVYSPNKIPPNIWLFLRFNPIVIIIDECRSIILWKRTIDYKELALCYCVSIAILTSGYLIFKKLRPYFAEVI